MSKSETVLWMILKSRKRKKIVDGEGWVEMNATWNQLWWSFDFIFPIFSSKVKYQVELPYLVEAIWFQFWFGGEAAHLILELATKTTGLVQRRRWFPWCYTLWIQRELKITFFCDSNHIHMQILFTESPIPLFYFLVFF